jgi:hypothetical protein
MNNLYKTQQEAEKASNSLFLEKNPEGTTELLYGWILTAKGEFQLVGAPELLVDIIPIVDNIPIIELTPDYTPV